MEVLLFAFASFVTIATPGTTTLMLVTRASRFGARGCRSTIVAIAAADIVLIAGALIGSAAASLAGETVWTILRVTAAGYLLSCALRSLKPHFAQREGTVEHHGHAKEAHGLTAFAAHVTNPKAALFFAALIPAFIVPGDHVDMIVQVLRLCSVHLVICAITLSAFAKAGELIGKLPNARALTRGMEALTGLVLLGVGMGLLAQVFM